MALIFKSLNRLIFVSKNMFLTPRIRHKSSIIGNSIQELKKMVDDILENLYTKIFRGIKLQPLITKSINDDIKFTCNKTVLNIRYFSFDFFYFCEQEKIVLCMEHCISCGIVVRNDHFLLNLILAKNCFKIKYERKF